MITIQSGKLTIPEEDRFVGFAGDNSGTEKQFVLPGVTADNNSYTLCLRFDDDSVRMIPLTKSLGSGALILTWTVLSSHLIRPGIVMAQIRSVGSDDVILHTSCDYFIVAHSAENGEESYEFITEAELNSRLAVLTELFGGHVPYIGEDGYLYVYDLERGAYIQSGRSRVEVDNTVIPNSANPVESRAIKAYIDSGMSSKVNKNTRIAGIELTSDISKTDLIDNLHGNINPPFVVPDTTVGYSGQFGKTADDAPVMCQFTTTWVRLATQSDLSGKMAMAPVVNTEDIGNLAAGQLFMCHGGVALKTQSGFTELAKKESVYTKTEIDSLIGSLETILSGV